MKMLLFSKSLKISTRKGIEGDSNPGPSGWDPKPTRALTNRPMQLPGGDEEKIGDGSGGFPDFSGFQVSSEGEGYHATGDK